MTSPLVRYQSATDLWWRSIRGTWTGPFATLQGAVTLSLHETFTPEQRRAFRGPPRFLRPRRLCELCRQVVRPHHKYTRLKGGKVQHRVCDDPEPYGRNRP